MRLSIRTLHRHLRPKRLYRSGDSSDTRVIIDFIENEISESCPLLGYRKMHKRCVMNGLKVTQHQVSIILKHLGPEGVSRRQRYRL